MNPKRYLFERLSNRSKFSSHAAKPDIFFSLRTQAFNLSSIATGERFDSRLLVPFHVQQQENEPAPIEKKKNFKDNNGEVRCITVDDSERDKRRISRLSIVNTTLGNNEIKW
jgi:hypothetical protein